KGVGREGGAAQFIAGIYISSIDNVSLNVGREFSRTIQPAHGGNVLQLSRHRFWACDVERIGNDTRNGGVGDRYHPGGVGGGTDCACAGAIVTRGGGHKDASIAGVEIGQRVGVCPGVGWAAANRVVDNVHSVGRGVINGSQDSIYIAIVGGADAIGDNVGLGGNA